MKEKVQAFDFNEHSVRFLRIDGQPYFVGKDVTRVLDYSNASKAMVDHVDTCNKVKNTTLSCLGQRGGWLINGSGVLSLVQFCNTKSHSFKKKLLDAFFKRFGPLGDVSIKSRRELEFGNLLLDIFRALDIVVETQKVSCSKYKIDFYIPKYRIAVEYDEKQHNHNQVPDLLRQRDIEKELSCEFVRVKDCDSDSYNVGLVLNSIFNKLSMQSV